VTGCSPSWKACDYAQSRHGNHPTASSPSTELHITRSCAEYVLCAAAHNTYVSTWSGWVYTAFVTDAYARRILGWRCGTTMTTQLVLDALDQAIWTRQRTGADLESVVAHSDRGSQYTSLRYGERLAEAGISPSVGSVGDSFDNALAETINGLYKTELIKPRGPWKTVDDVEIATAEWVDWFNHRRLYEYCGDIPPAELEAAYYAQHQPQAVG
jgi:putative transposase